MRYKYSHDDGIILKIFASGAVTSIPMVVGNRDYDEILEKNPTIEAADPLPAPEPSRDQKLKEITRQSKQAFLSATTTDQKINALAGFMDKLELILKG